MDKRSDSRSSRGRSFHNLGAEYAKRKFSCLKDVCTLRHNPIDPNDPKSKKTEDDKEKADILGKYFCSVFTSEPDTAIPLLPARNIENPLSEIAITSDKIKKYSQN